MKSTEVKKTKLEKLIHFLGSGNVFKREFCFWIIPSGRTSEVKKIRVPVWKLCSLVSFAAIILGGLLFIACDYVRLYGINGRHYAMLKTTSNQRNSLLGEQDDLKAKIDSFVAANSARASLDKELEVKLDELSSFIEDSNAVYPNKGIRTKNNRFFKSKETEEIERAIGGLEKGCSGKGCSLVEQDLLFSDKNIYSDRSVRASLKSNRLFDQANSAEDQLERLNYSLKILRAIPLLVPVQGDVSSGFGFRWSPFEHGIAKHEGIDFVAPIGTAIGSAGDGVVKEVKRNSTYGLMVDIQHTSRIVTRYAHLSSALVVAGDKVLRGDLIGQTGSSGRSTGPHLHYEVIVDGRQVDPVKYLELTKRLDRLLARK